MCLYYSKSKTENFLKKNKEKKFIYADKVLRFLKGHVVSPYQSQTFWKEGWIKSNFGQVGLPIKKTCENCDLYYGIHVHITPKTLNKDEKHLARVKVKCMLSDLLGGW